MRGFVYAKMPPAIATCASHLGTQLLPLSVDYGMRNLGVRSEVRSRLLAKTLACPVEILPKRPTVGELVDVVHGKCVR